MRKYLSGLFFAGLIIAAVSPASAATACTDFTGTNGTTGFPGTFVGTVGNAAGQVCQIGNISANNVSGTGTFVNNSQSTSIYSFYWGGGTLTIQEKLGNNGLGKAVDVYLDALATSSSTSPSSTISSTVIPFSSGPSVFYTVADNLGLAAGYYAIATVLGENAADPTFQVNFTATATPEPASLALVLGGLAGLTLLRRRQTVRA